MEPKVFQENVPLNSTPQDEDKEQGPVRTANISLASPDVTLQIQVRKLRCQTPVVCDGDTQRRGNEDRHAETGERQLLQSEGFSWQRPLTQGRSRADHSVHHFISCSPLTSPSGPHPCVTFRRCQGLADQRWPTAFLLVPHLCKKNG